jgi:hypothetical protein
VSWCQAPFWDPRPIFLSPRDFLLDSYCHFVITYINSVRTSQETQYLSVLQPGTLTTRPQRRSCKGLIANFVILFWNLFHNFFYVLISSKSETANFKSSLLILSRQNERNFLLLSWSISGSCILLLFVPTHNQTHSHLTSSFFFFGGGGEQYSFLFAFLAVPMNHVWSHVRSTRSDCNGIRANKE